MKPLLAFGIGLLFALAALPSVAADKQVKATPSTPSNEQQAQPQQSTNWNGGQIGAANGLSAVNNNFAEPGAYICGALETFGSNCTETLIKFNGRHMSYTVGPFLGWRWQFENYVAGVEADWSWKRGATSSAFYMPSACFSGPGSFCRSDNKSGWVNQDWDGSFRARYGFLVTPSTLIYGTGGLAISQIGGAFNFNSTVLSGLSSGGTAISNSSWSDLRAGATAGAGIETEVWTGWKARIEYRYTDFGTYTKLVPVTTLCPSCVSRSSSASIDLRESFHTVRIGLGFDF